MQPLCNTTDGLEEIQHPEEGVIEAADLTQTMAIGARNMAVEIYRNTAVVRVEQSRDGWVVRTSKEAVE